MKGRLPGLLQHGLGLVIVLLPLVACIAAGSIETSLWLDEVTYWYYEDQPSLREIEAGRPGVTAARYFPNYFYCDIQRGVHAVAEVFGLTLHSAPELYLRLFSLLSFAAAAALVYWKTFRESRSWPWSITAALAVSASPLLLFYAFEARVSAFAALGVIAYFVLATTALRNPERKGYWIAGALLSIFLTHLHLWIVCLYAALGIVALLRCLILRTWRELPPVLAFAVPGALTIAVEAASIALTSPSGGHQFPLYLPMPLRHLVDRTIGGTFSAGGTPPPTLLAHLPLIALGVALVLLVVQLRRSTDALFPAAAVLGLLISVALGATAGYLIAPRYQVPLFAAVFASLRLANTRSARIAVGVVVALQLLLMPKVVSDIAGKANGKEIATVIESDTPRDGTAIVVQHGLRLTYPDPLHSFVLHFYLDELRPDAKPIPLFELPSLRDITGERGLTPYFSGGEDLLRRYAAIPAGPWRRWLGASPIERIWLVTPAPVYPHEHAQADAFRAAMQDSGFTPAPSRTYRFEGYPLTYVSLFVRSRPGDRGASRPE